MSQRRSSASGLTPFATQTLPLKRKRAEKLIYNEVDVMESIVVWIWASFFDPIGLKGTCTSLPCDLASGLLDRERVVVRLRGRDLVAMLSCSVWSKSLR
jgi:hypothetical protein